MKPHTFTWIIGIVFLIMLPFVVIAGRKADVNNQRQLYESYTRVYKIEMSYEDWKILRDNGKLPQMIGSK